MRKGMSFFRWIHGLLSRKKHYVFLFIDYVYDNNPIVYKVEEREGFVGGIYLFDPIIFHLEPEGKVVLGDPSCSGFGKEFNCVTWRQDWDGDYIEYDWIKYPRNGMLIVRKAQKAKKDWKQ